MTMEKRGVVADENEVPVTKQAAETGCCQNQCHTACGDDLLSRAADEVKPRASADAPDAK